MSKIAISVKDRTHGATLPLGCALDTPMPRWKDLRNIFTKIAQSHNIDVRLRILATIYRYGYLLQPSVIFKTRLGPNALDLDAGTWHIIGTHTLQIPLNMTRDLQGIIAGNELFSNGWLLPKLDGGQYCDTAGLNALKPWNELKLPNYTTCRESFITWCKGEDRYDEMKIILDQIPVEQIVTYIPIPEQCLFCLDNIEAENQVALRLEHDSTWLQCHCCRDCLISYRDTRWSMLKDQLSGTDCLGQLKGFQKREVHRSLPFRLSTDDMVLGQVDSYQQVAELKLADGTLIDPSFKPNMTETSRAAFYEEMCALDITDVTEQEIRAVCGKYF